MDTLDLCDAKSKLLLNHMKNAISDITVKLSDIQQETAEENDFGLQSDNDNLTSTDCKNTSIDDENDNCIPDHDMKNHGQLSDNLDETSKVKEDLSSLSDHLVNNTNKSYSENATKLFDHGTPIVEENIFRQRLLGSQTRSSTPKLLPQAPPRKIKRHYNNTQRTDVLERCIITDELWSVDSRPIALAPSQGSSIGDFHHVEAVLPRSRRSLNGQLLGSKLECGDDELSDGSQSHTVFTIAKLISNLNAEKKKNKELEEKIQCLEHEVSSAKIQVELEQAKNEEKESGHLANLVEEIYHAQRERESAVLARLKLATQERDEALLRAKAIAKDAKFKNHDENNNIDEVNDTNMIAMLDAVCEAESGRAAEKHGRDLLARITNIKHERNRITSEEMQTVIRERDNALHRCHMLAHEVKCQKEKLKSDSSPVKINNQSMKTSLYCAQEDRDAALKKLAVAQDEMETLRIYYSLHKTLAENGKLKIESTEQDDASRLAEALRVAHEHNRVQDANARRNEAEVARLTEKNQRLERLVNVLRKKLTILAQKSARNVAEAGPGGIKST